MFISRFKNYENAEALAQVGPNDFQSIMPWYMYSGMTEQDLGAIYTYLQSITPIDNKIEIFKPRN